MAKYIDQAYNALFASSNPEELIKKSVSPPSTLELIPGSLTKSIGNWNLSLDNQEMPDCMGEVTLFNGSGGTVIFQNIQVRLIKAPQVNTQYYRLLNVCSLPSTVIREKRHMIRLTKYALHMHKGKRGIANTKFPYHQRRQKQRPWFLVMNRELAIVKTVLSLQGKDLFSISIFVHRRREET
jgi:hypothetical protein